MSNEVQRYADAAMFRSEPMPKGQSGPTVTLLNATPDPLGSLAALCKMYTGTVVRSLADITDEERRFYFKDVFKSELQGPVEVAQFHFLVENVTRGLTHQMVRQRQAFFAQESLRFAVPEEDWAISGRVPYPPSVAGDYLREATWRDGVDAAQVSYDHLINMGVPAEDARGILPHSITTRLHWVVDLRGLLHVAGLRLCTQAQFEWRLVMASAVKALREYRIGPVTGPATFVAQDGWQFNLIADALKPVCYQTGTCGFQASADRSCTIRERVLLNAAASRPSVEWEAPGNLPGSHQTIEPIHPYEWAADPTAARRVQA